MAGSSSLDWCEDNLTTQFQVKEFTNTASSLVFMLLPLITLSSGIWSNFSSKISLHPVILLHLMFFIGVSSAYYHATLSHFGEIVGSVFLQWVSVIGFVTLLPSSMRPRFFRFRNDAAIVIFTCIFFTSFWAVTPRMNGDLLLGSLVFTILLKFWVLSSKEYRPIPIRRIAIVCVLLEVSAMTCWVADCYFCENLKNFGISTGLHYVWHINIAISAYLNITVFSFVKAIRDHPKLDSTINYIFICIPFVKV